MKEIAVHVVHHHHVRGDQRVSSVRGDSKRISVDVLGVAAC